MGKTFRNIMQQLTHFKSDALRIFVSLHQSKHQLCFSFRYHDDDYWYQEDIKCFYDRLFSLLDDITIKEIISGADRENIRFLWQQRDDFILNFDCYSQSCWLEAENEFSQQQIPALFNSLTNKG